MTITTDIPQFRQLIARLPEDELVKLTTEIAAECKARQQDTVPNKAGFAKLQGLLEHLRKLLKYKFQVPYTATIHVQPMLEYRDKSRSRVNLIPITLPINDRRIEKAMSAKDKEKLHSIRVTLQTLMKEVKKFADEYGFTKAHVIRRLTPSDHWLIHVLEKE